MGECPSFFPLPNTTAGAGPPFCGRVDKAPGNLQLICDDDTGHATIVAIPFASYGAASGAPPPSCGQCGWPPGCTSWRRRSS